MVRRLGRFSSRVRHWVVPERGGVPARCNSSGQAWTSAVTLPHGRNGLSARRMAVLYTLREPSLGRQVQTGPRHIFHQCGIKLTGSDTVSSYISTHDLCMLETSFYLYTALLLVELMLAIASRLNSAPAERMLWPRLRQVHREFMRSIWLDLTPIIPATACHQRNYVEGYGRSIFFGTTLLHVQRQNQGG
jgi:hypothetical protein